MSELNSRSGISIAVPIAVCVNIDESPTMSTASTATVAVNDYNAINTTLRNHSATFDTPTQEGLSVNEKYWESFPFVRIMSIRSEELLFIDKEDWLTFATTADLLAFITSRLDWPHPRHFLKFGTENLICNMNPTDKDVMDIPINDEFMSNLYTHNYLTLLYNSEQYWGKFPTVRIMGLQAQQLMLIAKEDWLTFKDTNDLLQFIATHLQWPSAQHYLKFGFDGAIFNMERDESVIAKPIDDAFMTKLSHPRTFYLSLIYNREQGSRRTSRRETSYAPHPPHIPRAKAKLEVTICQYSGYGLSALYYRVTVPPGNEFELVYAQTQDHSEEEFTVATLQHLDTIKPADTKSPTMYDFVIDKDPATVARIQFRLAPNKVDIGDWTDVPVSADADVIANMKEIAFHLPVITEAAKKPKETTPVETPDKISLAHVLDPFGTNNSYRLYVAEELDFKFNMLEVQIMETDAPSAAYTDSPLHLEREEPSLPNGTKYFFRVSDMKPDLYYRLRYRVNNGTWKKFERAGGAERSTPLKPVSLPTQTIKPPTVPPVVKGGIKHTRTMITKEPEGPPAKKPTKLSNKAPKGRKGFTCQCCNKEEANMVLYSCGHVAVCKACFKDKEIPKVQEKCMVCLQAVKCYNVGNCGELCFFCEENDVSFMYLPCECVVTCAKCTAKVPTLKVCRNHPRSNHGIEMRAP